MRTAYDIIQQTEQAQRATAAIAWAISSDSYIEANPVQGFKARGWGHYSDFVIGKKSVCSRVIKVLRIRRSRRRFSPKPIAFRSSANSRARFVYHSAPWRESSS